MERNIPGTINIIGREFCYIEDDGKDKFEEELFDKVTSPYEFTNAKYGGIISENCKLWIQMSFFMVYLIKGMLMDGVKIYLMGLRNLIY